MGYTLRKFNEDYIMPKISVKQAKRGGFSSAAPKSWCGFIAWREITPQNLEFERSVASENPSQTEGRHTGQTSSISYEWEPKYKVMMLKMISWKISKISWHTPLMDFILNQNRNSIIDTVSTQNLIILNTNHWMIDPPNEWSKGPADPASVYGFTA